MVLRKLKQIKSITLAAKPNPGKGRAEYHVPCPRSFESTEIADCKGCSYWMAFGAEPADVFRGGRSVKRARPTVDCNYVAVLGSEEMESYSMFYHGFYGKKPKKTKKIQNDIDSLIEETLSHLHPHQRSEIE